MLRIHNAGEMNAKRQPASEHEKFVAELQAKMPPPEVLAESTQPAPAAAAPAGGLSPEMAAIIQGSVALWRRYYLLMVTKVF